MYRGSKKAARDYRTYGRQRSVRLPQECYCVPGAVYFITVCCRRPRADLADPVAARTVLDTWREVAQRCGFRVWGICVMPDHLHTMLEARDRVTGSGFENDAGATPGTETGRYKRGPTLSDLVRDAKSLTLSRLRGIAPLFWQGKFYDHVLRPDEDAWVRLRYLLENPVRRNLVCAWDQWPWSYVDEEAFK